MGGVGGHAAQPPTAQDPLNGQFWTQKWFKMDFHKIGKVCGAYLGQFAARFEPFWPQVGVPPKWSISGPKIAKKGFSQKLFPGPAGRYTGHV